MGQPGRSHLAGGYFNPLIQFQGCMTFRLLTLLWPAAGGLIMVFGGVDPENAPFPAEAVADSFGAGGFF